MTVVLTDVKRVNKPVFQGMIHGVVQKAEDVGQELANVALDNFVVLNDTRLGVKQDYTA
jgi:hypothetical protein